MIVATLKPMHAVLLPEAVRNNIECEVYAYNECRHVMNVKNSTKFLQLDFSKKVYFLVDDEENEESKLFDILWESGCRLEEVANSFEITYQRVIQGEYK